MFAVLDDGGRVGEERAEFKELRHVVVFLLHVCVRVVCV